MTAFQNMKQMSQDLKQHFEKQRTEQQLAELSDFIEQHGSTLKDMTDEESDKLIDELDKMIDKI